MTSTSSLPSAFSPLSANNRRVTFPCGDFEVVYVLDEKSSAVGLRLLPLAAAGREVPPRPHHEGPETAHSPAMWRPTPATRTEISLVQLKLREDEQAGAFACGRTMRQSRTVAGLRLERQTAIQPEPGGWLIETELKGARDFRCVHVLRFEPGDEAVTVHTEFTNTGTAPLTLEMLASFTLGHLTPFHAGDAPEQLWAHRFRSSWAGEGRHERVALEDLHLERSPGSFGVRSERFGQVGSKPVNDWFPFVAIEDSAAGVFWGAQLHAPGSWQMEIYRPGDDRVAISGGWADREFGHWMRTVAPGERVATLPAWLTTSQGNFDGFCQRLTRMQAKALRNAPASEATLPILFNEWCSSWGLPTPEFIQRTAERLRELPVEIFVIDDGWAAKPPGGFQFNGDWNVETRRFPDGLAPVVAALRDRGLRAGLWFEFEVCTEGTRAWELTEHQLHRDGRPLQVDTRRFWDFTDPWTNNYLADKVTGRLRDDGFGYLKIDYNETIGLGADHPDGLGEGLRRHLEGVQAFIRRLRAELPELVIENCSSGGHRLEPSFLGLCSMASFSDAHEPVEVPIIAASLHRLILPRQNQIWAVVHPDDSLQRLHWSLAAGCLGRLCLSGEIADLDPEQMALVRADLEFYRAVAPIIRDGESRLITRLNKSWRHPRGWQALVRTARGGRSEALIVVHAFAGMAGESIELEWPEGGPWTLQTERGVGSTLEATPQVLRLTIAADFAAHLIHLTGVC
jgi:alpha-galactosidase